MDRPVQPSPTPAPTPAPVAAAYLELGPDGEALDALDPAYLQLFGLTPEELDALEAVEPARRPQAIRDAVAQRCADPAAFRGAVEAHRAAPAQPRLDDIALADGRVLRRYTAPRFGADGRVIGRLLFLSEVTSEQQAARERARRASQQQTVAALADAALSTSGVAPILALAARLVAATLEADLVHVIERRADGDLWVSTSNVPNGGLPHRARGRMGDGSLAHHVLLAERALTTADLPHDDRFPAPVLRALGVVSSAAVLVRGRERERPFGALEAHWRRRHACDDGELRFLEAVGNVLAGVLARQAVETALHDRERQLRAVFDHALEGLVTLGPGLKLVDANPEAARIFGRSREELLALEPAELLGGPARVEEVERALVGTGRYAGELEIAPADVPRRQIELQAVASILPGLHLGMVRDVTERRAVQERLALADRMASVGTLAAGVAHELNNPLASVTANLGWLSEQLGRSATALGDDAADVLAALEDLRDGTGRMRAIVRDLSTFSHADPTRTGPVELVPVVESCLHVADNEIRHRARLVRELGQVPAVLANEGRLAQALLNLLVNAAQAIEEGHADRNVIRVATRPLPDGRVAVEVEDTGHGIRPEHRPRLFDPFFTTRPPGVGTGLGLTIAHNFITAVGGEIEVESAPGAGALFRVLLRTWASTVPAPPPGEAPALAPGRPRVLIVDDEELVAWAIARPLQREYDVQVVASARQALDRLEAGDRVDLLVTDLLMPEQTGIDLWRAVQARDAALAARMIFVTGGAFTETTRAFVAEHRERCLEKPFELSALRALVRRQLAAVPPAPGDP